MMGRTVGVLALARMHPLRILATTVGTALLVWGLLFAYVSSPAWASTITVNSLADDADGTDGECTLREAITSANTDTRSGAAAGECAAGSGEHLIDIGVSSGTVNLTGALPDLSSNLAIEGPGADKFTVRRDSGGDYRIFTVPCCSSQVSISGITITNGKSDGDGGGIFSGGGTLTITGSTISVNTASGHGGGIYSECCNLTVTDSTVSGNTASGSGGGILGGGLVTGSTISGNTSGGFGGGIFGGGLVTGSTISGNSAPRGPGGGIATADGLRVTDSTISGNTAGSGGGIWSHTTDAGRTTITNSTISGNSAGFGGGVYNLSGPAVIEFSTITNNTATNTTVPFAGGGVHEDSGYHTTRTEVLSSIISANQGTDVASDGLATNNRFVSRGYNLIGDGNATGAFNQTGDQTAVSDPKLDALGNYGGPTQTHPLKVDSPAINAIPSATNGCGTEIATDQRGIKRPQGGKCEIGSFEDRSPKVTRVVPLQVATSVAPDTSVSAFFSEAMRASTINVNTFKLFKVGTTTPVGAQVSYDAFANKAILNPNANLELGSRYKAVVTTGVRDLAANRLDQDLDPSNGNQPKVWYFTVRN